MLRTHEGGVIDAAKKWRADYARHPPAIEVGQPGFAALRRFDAELGAVIAEAEWLKKMLDAREGGVMPDLHHTKVSGSERRWIAGPLNRWIGEADALNQIPEAQKLRACRTQLRAVLSERDALRYAIEHVVVASPHVPDTVKQYLRAALERPE